MNGWRIEDVDGIRLVRSDLLDSVPGVAHAFSTRVGPGGESFDLGSTGSDDPVLTARRSRLTAAAGMPGRVPAMLQQVHGDRVLDDAEPEAGEPPRADGLVALRAAGPAPVDRIPAVRVADCVPLLIASRDGRAVAAVHAGWRGTAAAIALRAVERLALRGVSPEELRAALGPAIGACCYAVGPEVVDKVARGTAVHSSEISRKQPNEALHVDLRLANRLQLESAGLPPDSVTSAPWCSACHSEMFYSYRREGTAAGRMLACIGWSG
jgi:YfiH family protein